MLELAVLGLLKEKSMHGYELKKRLDEQLGHFWRISYGSLYPSLKRLAADGARARRLSNHPRNWPRWDGRGVRSGAVVATAARSVESPALDVDYLKASFKMEAQSIELTEVMRQEEESGILFNATNFA